MLNIIVHLFLVIPIFNVVKGTKLPNVVKFLLASIVFAGLSYLHYLEFCKPLKSEALSIPN